MTEPYDTLARSTLALALLACGCSRQSAAPHEPANSVSAEIHQTAFGEPLSAAEINAFRKVVAELPGGRVPDFATASSVRVNTRNLSPAQIIDEQRARFRTTLDPFRQAQLWRIDPLIGKALEEMQVEPEAFAMLMIRISTGWAATAFVDEQGRGKCESLKQIADRHVEELSRQILRLDAAPLQDDPRAREHIADALVDTVALSEFLGLLSRVPPETVQLISRQRDQLRPLMPAPATVAEFERRLESTAQVVPAGYIAP